MRNWMKNAGHVALVGAGFFAIGSGIASADVSDNNGSLLSGNQVEAPVSAPVNVTGNALGVLGHATAKGPSQSQQGSAMGASERGALMSTNRGSVLSGNQIKAPISVPVNICGNAAAIKGVAQGSCTQGTTVSAPTQACESAIKTWSAPKSTCNTTPTAPAPAAPVSACQPAIPAAKSPCENHEASSVKTLPACQPVAPAVKAPCESPEASSVKTLPACQPVAPAVKAPCENPSSARTLPATSPFSVTSMAVPTRRQHSAAQEVMTYEKLTSVRQAAGATVDGAQSYVAVPTGE